MQINDKRVHKYDRKMEYFVGLSLNVCLFLPTDGTGLYKVP